MSRPRRDGPSLVTSEPKVDAATDASERWLRQFSPRVQAWILVGGGMLLTALSWLLVLLRPPLVPAARGQLQNLTLFLLVVGPTLLVYGLLRLVVRPIPAPPPGSQFGGVLIEAEAEQRWKHRLLALAVGAVHAMVGIAMG